VLRSFRQALGGDLRSLWLLCLKAVLSLFLEFGLSLVLLCVNTGLTKLVFLSVVIWGFCRFCCFCFCVIDKYIDHGSRYSSLFLF